ncbi:hypothetical protein DITRI_Ditri19aG0083000 [Diplodiscus trichospermus]
MLWAPFLLLHLGNAETMAANYLEESTLWIRYLVGLLIQFGMAFYIYLRFQTKHPGFNFLAMLIFIAGMIKCGERIWILSFSSFEKYKESMLRAPPPEIPHTCKGKFDLPKHEPLVDYLKKKCMTKPNSGKLPKCVGRAINYWLDYRKKNKGITLMAQNSLLKYCLKSKATEISAAAKKLHLGNTFLEKSLLQLDQKLQPPGWFDIDLELKDFIYSYLKEKRKQYAEKMKFDFKSLPGLLNEGAYEFLKTIKLQDEVGWSLKDLEFTHSLLLWHIATDILYYDQRRRYPRGSFSTRCQISKHLSDYMMHLLVKAPFMLRKGIGELRYRDTCREAVKFFNREMRIKGVRLAATSLLAIDAESREFLYQMRGQGKSVFFGGSALAIGLRRLSQDEKCRMDEEEVWEIINCVWMEMLVSAVNHCNWKDHIIQLRHGKELLTHVALLMAHLGLSKHIRMTDLPQQLEAEGENYNPPWNWDELNRLAYYLA